MKSFAISALLGAVAVADRSTCTVQQTGINNFDVKSFAGTWYEIVRTQDIGFQTGICDKAEYTFDVDHINVVNSEQNDGVVKHVDGTAYCMDDGTANCQVAFSPLETKKPSGDNHNYDVLETDYKNYAIVHTCAPYVWGLYTVELIWIFSRINNPEEAEVEKLIDAVKDYGFDTSKLQRTYQGEKCNYE